MKITIGCFKIPVKFIRTSKVGSDCAGKSIFGYPKIYIDIDQPLFRQQEALIHEIVEQINHMYELNLKHQTTQTLGLALCQALSNKRIIKFLIKD